MLKQIEQTLDSREVAEMVEKEHHKLLRDIRKYEQQFTEAKIGFSEFFKESSYKDTKGETRPCYRITKKGCEFIAHKLTGIKGTIFTARYINRFHEMQEMILRQEIEPELPWFIRKFKGEYIVLFRDFEAITGVNPFERYTALKWPNRLIGGRDYNGYGWKCDNEKFKQEFGFDYGEDDCMFYLYPCGVIKAINLLAHDSKAKQRPEAKEMLVNGINMIRKPRKEELKIQNTCFKVTPRENTRDLPIQINISLC